MADQKKPAQRTVTSVDVLPVRLTQEEWSAAARELATLRDEYDAAEKILAKAKAEFKSIEADLKKRTADLSEKVKTGKERREVEVKVIYDYEERKVVRMRSDTMEILIERAMTIEESQMKLPTGGETVN